MIFNILKFFPYLLYILLVIPLYNQLPMHEEVIHLIESETWNSALQYWWHPPSYVIILKLFREFIFNNFLSAYLLGSISALINIYIIGRILFILLSNLSIYLANVYVLLGRSLFASLPIVISGSILLEMEPVLVTPFLLASILLYLIKLQNDTIKNNIIFGLFLGITLWGKTFVTPIIFILSIFIYEYFTNLNWKRNIFINFFLSISFFIITYSIYSFLFLVDDNTISFIFNQKINADLPIYKNLAIFLPIVSKFTAWLFWFSPFFVILIVYIFSFIIKSHKNNKFELFLVFFCIFLICFYLIGSPYLFFEFKYFYPVFPVIVIIIISTCGKNNFFTSPNYKSSIYIIISIIVLFLLFGDPLYNNLSLMRTSNYYKLFVYNLFYFIFCITLLYIFFILFRKSNNSKITAFLTSLLILTFSSNANMLFSQYIGGYQTKYQYGERGAREVIDYINKNIPETDSVFLSYDINYYVEKKFIKVSDSILDINSAVDIKKWNWIVVRKVSLNKISMNNFYYFNKVYDEGSYVIYKSNLIN